MTPFPGGPVRNRGAPRYPAVRACCRWRFSLGRNPLRRRQDRLQTALSLGVTLLFAALVPVGIAFGATEIGQRADRLRAAYASAYPVEAVLVEPAGGPVTGFTTARRVNAPARWTAPDGSARTGLVPAPVPATPGTRVPIRVDAGGRPVPEPPDAIELRAEIAAAGVLATLVVLVAVVPVYVFGVWLLDRRRLAEWGEQWIRTSTRWSERR